MSTSVKGLLDTFNHLTLEEQWEAVCEILRRVRDMESPPLAYETVDRIADESFLEYDPREATAMRIERFRDMYQAQPFRPFVIHLADGREIPVHHREFLALGPGGRTVLVYQPDESFNIVDLL